MMKIGIQELKSASICEICGSHSLTVAALLQSVPTFSFFLFNFAIRSHPRERTQIKTRLA